MSVPYVRGVSEPVARLLQPSGIQVGHRAEPWRWKVCRHIKEPLEVRKRKGVVYSTECGDSGSVYIGETGRTLEDRCEERQRHTRLNAAEKSAVAEHTLTLGHWIDWESARVINIATGMMQRWIKEKLHIERLTRKKSIMNKDFRPRCKI